jgi:hypothetical protein
LDLPFRVTEVQPTPNPNALKFILDHRISDRPMSFFDASAAEGHTVASALFGVPGVSGLLLLGDFVTVTKSPQAAWADISSKVKDVLAII